MEMARGVGTPLQLDPMTKEGRFGFDARVLVDVDLSKPLPESIMIEREGFAFPVEVVYEKFPPICDYCGIIGHSISSCRQNSKKKDSDTVSKSKVNQVYRVKNPSSIPTSNPELETEFTGKSSSPLVLNAPSDIRVGKNPENPTDHADDIDKE